MNKYMIIRSDNKSISPPMSKHEAIIKLKEYNKKGISTLKCTLCQGQFKKRYF